MSSAKQQREMTKFCIVYGTWATYFPLESKDVVAYLVLKSDWIAWFQTVKD